METAGKILGFVTAILSVLATVAVTYILRWWVPQQSIRTLRDELQWYVHRIEEKDEELARLRLEHGEANARLEVLEQKYEVLREAGRDRNSYLYGLERYVKRLEALCTKQKIPLPPRENGEG